MKRIVIAALASLLFVASCQKVPLSNRNQLMLVSSKEILPMSFKSYREFLDTNKVVRSGASIQSVRRVGLNIQKAVESYLAENNYSQLIEGFQWEYNVVDNPQMNAFCMPGGKVVFYTGILPICQNDEGIAVVMGHEIAHAIASHGAERMSQGLLSQGVLTAGQVGLGVALSNKPQQTQSIYNGLYGLAAPAAAQVGYLLPNSRNQESEADKLGLIFMAKAGYNPEEAVAFWTRMQQQSKGQKPPEFLSTHPSDDTRIRDLNRQIPGAMKYYSKAR
ncbi:Zn-dependent protease with chaperone function [Rhabdobacter roseus]|uniref:Zn-dependent protease with chaperone function n=1 Tax=Rhabdobacter roseus TaxID=1655419 RepID=A0A840TR24_9BACT|nr:M48 family metallopeptidase [Rhabdobacter roseus]MBB5283683.1 Zn-dependent protease with chaperone function [Rhabdobacter roseus]